MPLGQNLARLRKARTWTQDELGRQSGVPATTIRGYEIGRSSPTTEALAKLAKALGCSIDEIVFEEGSGVAQARITDPDLLHRFEEVQKMEEADREVIKRVLDAMLVCHKLGQIIPSPRSLRKESLRPARAREDIKIILDQIAEALGNRDGRRGPRGSHQTP